MGFLSLILALAIISGQLIKIPLTELSSVTLLDLVVVFFVTTALVSLKFHLARPPIFISSFLFFLGLCLLSLLFSPLSLTLPQYLISSLYIARFFLYIMLAWILYSAAFPGISLHRFGILLFSGMTLAFLGLLQFIFFPDLRFLNQAGWDPHYLRVVSTFLDPNFAGAFFVLSLVLLYQKFFIAKKWKIILFSFLYATLLLTFSRGAYLAFASSFITLSFLNKSVRLFILTIILFSGLLLGFTVYQKTVAQPRNIDRSESAGFRVNTWLQGLTLFQQHLVLGVGFNSYRFALEKYGLANEQFLQKRGSTYNDSSLLHVAATTGILGLISYLFFLATLAKENWKEKIIPASLIGLLTQSFFANTLFYPFIFIWIILIAVRKK